MKPNRLIGYLAREHFIINHILYVVDIFNESKPNQLKHVLTVNSWPTRAERILSWRTTVAFLRVKVVYRECPSTWIANISLASTWLASTWLASTWLASTGLASTWLASIWLASTWLSSTWSAIVCRQLAPTVFLYQYIQEQLHGGGRESRGKSSVDIPQSAQFDIRCLIVILVKTMVKVTTVCTVAPSMTDIYKRDHFAFLR